MEDKQEKSKGNKFLGTLGYIVLVYLLSLLAIAILLGSGYKHSRQYGDEESTFHQSASLSYTE